jgi:chromate transporter
MILQRPSLIKIFLSFLALGSYAFGGPAMVVYIKDLAVRRNKWLDENTFKNGIVLCQSVPGAIAMQVAAYVGLKTRGPAGAIMSYLGFGLPAFVFMTILAYLYTRFHSLPKVEALFMGLKVIIVAIIVNAATAFSKSAIKDYRDVLIALASTALFCIGVSPFLVIIGAALAGYLLFREITDEQKTVLKKYDFSGLKYIIATTTLICLGMVFLYYMNIGLMKVAAVMLKIDIFAFGGGFAALPLMFHQVVDVKGWIDSKTFMDGIALGQITPGPIIITATFIGYLLYGFTGALVSTMAILTPSFLVVLLTVPFFDRLKDSRIFLRATRAILASFVGLLLFVAIKFALSIQWTTISAVLCLVAFIALYKKIHVLYVIFAATLISLVLFR